MFRWYKVRVFLPAPYPEEGTWISVPADDEEDAKRAAVLYLTRQIRTGEVCDDD